ncbi:MAG: GTP-binding protein [Promethearchaeota archaeon]|nr:MAG: GTP-binding protein [Candidatus Lokiarchaeota archaeon]
MFIINKDKIIYQRVFGNAINRAEVEDLQFRLKQDALKKLGKAVGYYDYFKYRIAYDVEVDLDLMFIFVTGLMDDFFRLTQTELMNFKNEFLNQFKNDLDKKDLDPSKFEALDPIIDSMHRNLKPKIAVVGFSGVGKTTIKNLIKKDQLPLQHIPTISGDIATVKIGNLEFRLFDFAGQEQFKYLWKGFIKGSNAVLIVTDSSPENVEKSRFFLKLVNEEAPYARSAIIGNKQDLKDAMKVEDIENILGLKTYPMIANLKENRDKMIHIIAEILDMNYDTSPLLKSVLKKETEDLTIQNDYIPVEVENKVSSLNAPQITKKDKNHVNTIPNNVAQMDDEQKDMIQIEEQSKPKHNNKIKIILADDLCEEVEKSIKGVKMEHALRNHYKMIGTTIKTLNNNKAFTFEEFYTNYIDYTNKEFRCKNIALKQFLTSQYSLLKKSIENDEIITSKLRHDNNAIANALHCAYLTLVNPVKYPDFKAVLKQFDLEIFDNKTINNIHAYYLRILNKLNND